MSRHLRTFLLAAGFAGVALLVWLDRGVLTPARTGRLSPHQPNFSHDLTRYHGKAFPVTRIVDGDTLHVAVPDGDNPTTKVRLLGIDAPEAVDDKQGQMYYAHEATEFVRRLAGGKAVTLYLDEGERSRGKYGRLLAYVELPDGRFLNDVLLLEGCVYADPRFRHSRHQKYRQLEAAARSLRKGLWAQVSREQLPAWLQRMQPDLLTGR